MRRKAKVDSNQSEIVDALRMAGCVVHCTHTLGGGFPDLVVGYKGWIHLLEVKASKHKRHEGVLTADEHEFHTDWSGYPVHVVFSVPDALEVVGCDWGVG